MTSPATSDTRQCRVSSLNCLCESLLAQNRLAAREFSSCSASRVLGLGINTPTAQKREMYQAKQCTGIGNNATILYGAILVLWVYCSSIELGLSNKKPKITVDWKAVGRRIRELRGFDSSQEEFADRIGVSQSYLSAIERGRKEVGAEILLRISIEFDTSLEWLLTGTKRRSRP